MKKKMIFSVLILGSLLSLTACGSDETSSTSSSKSTSSSSQVSSSSSSISSMQEKEVALNIEQVAKGDFSSIQGTWKNANGKSITFSGSEVSGSGMDNETYELGSASLSSNIVYVNAATIDNSDKLPNVIAFMMAQANQSPENETNSASTDLTDRTKDRMIWGTNGGADLFRSKELVNTFYYRVTE
ncbi:MAG: DUF6287 domain-containing protein [Lactococcus sp.]